MVAADKLAGCMGSSAHLVLQHADRLTEIRIRSGRPLRLRMLDGSEIIGNTVSQEELQVMISRMMEDSLYACEHELRNGYFTMAGGFRVGVCGKMNAGEQNVRSICNIASLCIRIPREVFGCAQSLFDRICKSGFGGVLIASAPGLGKTTLLRDLMRLISEHGKNVAIADERREIAACLEGVPQLDVGPRTDVMDGCFKTIALPMLLRACAPDYLAVDEIGGADEANALLDAWKCGVQVAATVHANSIAALRTRRGIGELLHTGLFRYIVLLGPAPGEIQSIEEYINEETDHAEGNIAFIDSDCLRRSGAHAVQRQKTPI